MPNIIRHPAIQDDIEEILDYLAPKNLEAALRLIDAFEQTVNTLAHHPRSGATPSFLTAPRHENIRYQIIQSFPNYLVFYREIEDGIELLHLLHGARDIPDIFEDA